MTRLLWCSLCLSVLAAVASGEEPASSYDQNWPHWRGPLVTGVAPHADPPVEWSEDKNVKWKIEIPGLGYSSPIVWGDRVFLLTAVDTGKRGQAPAEEAGEAEENATPQANAQEGERRRERRGRGGRGRGGRRGGGEAPTTIHDFVVMCINRHNGEVVWSKTANSQVPHEGFRSGDNSFASASPVTDGKHLFASFGSFGVYCYDLDGNQVWKRDLGDFHMRNGFGEGGTPALHGDWLIVNCDQEFDSFIAGLDARNGDVKWKVPRDEASSWSTPLIVDYGGKTQVVVNGANRVRSYDITDGDVIWECGGQTGNVIPVPVRQDDTVICMSGWKGSAIYALPLDAKGDITDSDKIVWHHGDGSRYRAGTPYVPSPLLYGDSLYFLKSYNGILTRMSAITGKPDFDNQRLNGVSRVYSSPVGAADRVYITGRDGTTIVLKNGPDFEVLATNRLDSPVDATMAVVGKDLFIRGQSHLYCISEE